MTFVGVDIETTGLDPSKGHRLIQLGLSFGTNNSYGIDVLPMGKMTIDQSALDVNGFTIERIQAGEPNDEVDARVALMLETMGYKEAVLTPVGWNVGAFDMHFIKHDLPTVAKFFSHRVMDLTPIAMLKAHQQGDITQWRILKESEHKKVEAILGKVQWHDAEFDAIAALLQWRLWTL